MFDNLSTSQLAKVFNAVTDGKPVRKFESKARAMALTQKELDRMGVTAPIALARAGFPVSATPMEPETWNALPQAADADAAPEPKRLTFEPAVLTDAGRSERAPSERFVRMAIDAVSGEPVAMKSLHGPVRSVAGDPEKAARKVASASVVELRAVRKAKAAEMPVAAPVTPAERPALRAGAKRTAATMGPVIAALRSADGATLAECTALAGWDAPFELRNLHIAARKRGLAIAYTGDGEARRYRLTGGES